MIIVLGATGHVGSATAKTLLKGGHPVTVVTRNAAKAERFRDLGAEVAEGDLHDVEGMRAILRRGNRLFLLNPPAPPQSDTDATEKDTARKLLEAINGSKLEKVVAESTYGAQPGENIGDLNTLYEMEEGLRKQGIAHTIIRAAYYFSNWDAAIDPAKKDGILPTMLPADLKLPMVAPEDLGAVAARLLLEAPQRREIHYVEGPDRYSPQDVADTFATVLGRPVSPMVTPRHEWETAFRKLGFSEAAAQSFTRMTEITADRAYEMPVDPIKGAVTLQNYLNSRVNGTD